MHISQGQLPILAATVAILAATLFLPWPAWYAGLTYAAVVTLGMLVVLLSNERIRYPNDLLWLFVAWAALHIAGGAALSGDRVLYELVLVPLVGEPYFIFKYDQLVHAYGFGVATLFAYHLLRPALRVEVAGRRVWLIVALAGLGIGGLNEIAEFLMTVLAPATNVGGYENTALDLVADALGAVGAVVYLRAKQLRISKAVRT